MGDPTDPGGQIGAHWGLIAIVAGTIVGIVMFLRVAREMLRTEMAEVIKLSLSNGAGDIIDQRIRLSVNEAVEKVMREHVFICPVKDRLPGIQERIAAQHDRLLQLEGAMFHDKPARPRGTPEGEDG